ncbi:hypothetical protein V496_09041 [Pseudogymnoascus sp. VKM F-4515 (FW-2607)]|nr:hypothetical protein V496_09041 [Pseudogymnoascus sp. VKM F-4515 (FW-2607)]KFY97643.1 hypothetical protein V498_01947 [Pseudogymnoascus sp. VKM F-4517 (FW-2822)]
MSTNTNSSGSNGTTMTVNTEDFITRLSANLKSEYAKMSTTTMEHLEKAMNTVTRSEDNVAEIKEMVGEAIGGALDRMVEQVVGGALPEMVDEAVRDALPEMVAEAVRSALPEIVAEAVRAALPKMMDETVLRALTEMAHRQAE